MSDYGRPEALVESNRYLPGDIDAEHERTKEEFLHLGPAHRIEVLKVWDAALENEHRPSRNLAELMTKRRELADMHFRLLKIGR